MSEILTSENIERRRVESALVNPPSAVTELCDSHEALRSSLTEETQRREQAERERDATAHRYAQVYADLIGKSEQATRERDQVRDALRAIVECRCAFSKDPLEHARNAAEFCQSTARAALASPAPPAEEKGAK